MDNATDCINELSPDQVQNAFQEAIDNEKKGWEGTITFKLFVVPKSCDTTEQISEFISSNQATEVDICEYLGNKNEYRGLYFDPNVYPPQQFEKGKEAVSWTNLKTDFLCATFNCGSPMIANGTSGNGARKFTCQVLYRRRKNLGFGALLAHSGDKKLWFTQFVS